MEFDNWKSQSVISNEDKMGLRRPAYAFTEQGVAMRKLISAYADIVQRLETVEQKQIETDKKIDKIFNALESKKL